jgi:hypothetical protein
VYYVIYMMNFVYAVYASSDPIQQLGSLTFQVVAVVVVVSIVAGLVVNRYRKQHKLKITAH